MSFRITLAPNRKAATRFIGSVRRRLQRAFVDNPDVSRSDVARQLDVHRSVITRQLQGTADMSLGRIAEIAWALGYRPKFELERLE
jgi:plasmid maintenance system antidote protein VapI